MTQDSLAIPRDGACLVVEPIDAAPGAEGLICSTDDAVSERVVGFDVLRVTAIVAILWFHSGGPGSDYLVWRLPALTMISATLATGRPSRRPLGEQVRRIASRLLIPWLFWCSVYGLVDGLDYLRKGRSFVQEMGPYALLSGPSLHLWFLPFAFTMAAVLHAARRVLAGMTRVSMPPAAGFALASVGAWAIIATRGTWANLPIPLPLWLASIPAVLFGLVIGTAVRRTGFGARGITLATIPALLACLLLEYLHGDVAVRYGFAVILVCLASMMACTLPTWARPLPQMAMGVYLVQGLVTRVSYPLFDRLPMVEPRTWIFALAVILGSFALVQLIRLTPVRCFV